MLFTFGHNVATSCNILDAALKLRIELVNTPRWHRMLHEHAWPNEHNIMQYSKMLQENFGDFQTWSNSMQHVATKQTFATCCAKNVAICSWPILIDLKITRASWLSQIFFGLIVYKANKKVLLENISLKLQFSIHTGIFQIRNSLSWKVFLVAPYSQAGFASFY